MNLKLANFPLLALSILCGRCLAGAAILAHGTPQTYWIAQIRPDAGGAIHTLIRQRDIGGSPAWQGIAQIDAGITSMANQGNQLAVLMDNGDWMLVWDGGSSSGSLPEDGAKLEQLAGGGDSLWAIARALGGRQPTTRGATQPAASMPIGTLLLYQLQQGRWTLIAPLPPLADSAQKLSLALFDHPTIAALEPGGQIQTFEFDQAAHDWQKLGNIAAPQASKIKFLTGLSRPLLWTGDDHGGGNLYIRNEAWSPPTALTIPPDELGDGVEDVTLAGQNVRVLEQGTGKIIEQSFAPDGTGRRRADLPGTIEQEGPEQFEWVSALTVAALMYVLMSTFRRRTPINLEKVETAGQTLAPPLRRLTAGLIDALPLLVTGAVVLARVPPELATDSQALLEAMHYPMLIAAAVYIGHILLCELIWGWSLGKKLCGLRVVTLEGARPPARAIVVRNLLRVIDISMAFLPVLLVIASPLRQRVGDVAAETIVVATGKGPAVQG